MFGSDETEQRVRMGLSPRAGDGEREAVAPYVAPPGVVVRRPAAVWHNDPVGTN